MPKYFAKFTKKLSFLLSAGIPFVEALGIMEEREGNKSRKKYLVALTGRIRSGFSVYRSFVEPPTIADPASLRVIQSAEISGTLSKGFGMIAIELEQKIEDQRRITGALAYPVCILFFSVALSLLLLLFVFPKILPLLTSSGVKLPLSTRLLIEVFLFLKMFWLDVVAGVVAFSILMSVLWKKIPSFRLFFYNLELSFPGIAFFIRTSKTASLSRLTSLFLESSHTLVEALSYVAEHETNPLYKESLLVVVDEVKKGRRFSNILTDFPKLFPLEMSQFAAMGEESGSLSRSLRETSRLYQEELKDIEKKLFSLIEPALMLFLGCAVGFIALSLISPIYSLTSSFNQPPI